MPHSMSSSYFFRFFSQYLKAVERFKKVQNLNVPKAAPTSGYFITCILGCKVYFYYGTSYISAIARELSGVFFNDFIVYNL